MTARERPVWCGHACLRAGLSASAVRPDGTQNARSITRQRRRPGSRPNGFVRRAGRRRIAPLKATVSGGATARTLGDMLAAYGARLLPLDLWRTRRTSRTRGPGSTRHTGCGPLVRAGPPIPSGGRLDSEPGRDPPGRRGPIWPQLGRGDSRLCARTGLGDRRFGGWKARRQQEGQLLVHAP